MTLILRTIAIFIFSPTRLVIEYLKQKEINYGRIIRIWNRIFRGIMFLAIAGLWWAGTGSVIRRLPFCLGIFLLWLFPFSRINELFFAYYRDAFQQIGRDTTTTDITPLERLQFLVGSYLEVAVQFGIIYFCFPLGYFKTEFESIIQAIYFSVVTITTAGYGDITPTKWGSQIACMYELAVGFVLIIFALGAYLTTTDRSPK